MYDFLYAYGSLKIKTRKCLKCHSVLEKVYKNVITWFHIFYFCHSTGVKCTSILFLSLKATAVGSVHVWSRSNEKKKKGKKKIMFYVEFFYLFIYSSSAACFNLTKIASVSAGHAWCLWEDGNCVVGSVMSSPLRFAVQRAVWYSIILTVPRLHQMPIFQERSYILFLIKHSSALLPECILLLVGIQEQKTIQNILLLHNRARSSLRQFLNGGQKITE